MSASYDYTVFIGRCQPVHNGHLAMMLRALELGRHLIVALGSAQRSRNIKHPFSDGEREAMIRAALDEALPGASARLTVCPIRDRYDDRRWAAAVRTAVGAVVPEGASVALVGHAKDHSTYYLRAFPEWPLVLESVHAHGVSATRVRALFFTDPDQGQSGVGLSTLLPSAVERFLEAFRQTPPFHDLAAEYREVMQGKAAWAVAPYPVVFVTVDAVLECAGHVLLIRRGGFPGRGQWALPGGFLDQNERLLAAAKRELAEETSLRLDAAAVAPELLGSAVFDYPDRSVRGRTVTHAFHFRMNQAELPVVQGGDDAAEARWVPVADLAGMSDRMFEDHLHIIDSFIPVYPDSPARG